LLKTKPFKGTKIFQKFQKYGRPKKDAAKYGLTVFEIPFCKSERYFY
jgi:hypothetical protein